MLKISNDNIMMSISINAYMMSISDHEYTDYTLKYKLSNLYLFLIDFNNSLYNICNINDNNKSILNTILLENLITKVLFNFDLLHNNNYNDIINKLILINKDILDDISHSVEMKAVDIIPIYNLLSSLVNKVFETEVYKTKKLVNELLTSFNLEYSKCVVAYLDNFIINYKQKVILFNTKILYME